MRVDAYTLLRKPNAAERYVMPDAWENQGQIRMLVDECSGRPLRLPASSVRQGQVSGQPPIGGFGKPAKVYAISGTATADLVIPSAA